MKDTADVLSNLKKRILGDDENDASMARKELMAMDHDSILACESFGSLLARKLLISYEAGFFRNEDELISRYNALQEELAQCVGQPVIVVSSERISVTPNDTRMVPPNLIFGQAGYLVSRFIISFGILASNEFLLDHLGELLLDTGGRYVEVVNRQPARHEIIAKNLKSPSYLWKYPERLEFVIGHERVKKWFHRHDDEENRLIGMYGYCLALLDKASRAKLDDAATSFNSALNERTMEIARHKSRMEELDRQVIQVLHQGVPLGLYWEKPEPYIQARYWLNHWPPLHPFPDP